MTRAEEIANDPRVTVAARIFMFATPLVVTIGVAVMVLVVNSQASARVALENRVSTIESFDANASVRISILESNSSTNKANRDKQINDINGRIDANQNAVAAKLDKLGDQMTQLSNQVAALNAVLTAQARRP